MFSLRLAPEIGTCVERNVHWLRHLLERLGRDAALAVWEQALSGQEDPLLAEILDGDWRADPGELVHVAGRLDAALSTSFARPVEGVSAAEARALVERIPPFPQVRQRLADLNRVREITTHDSLHLLLHGQALLIEALIDRRGMNPRIRMQRTTTLMEGGAVCDFRIYALPERDGEER